jgi:predicted nucleic acid-binding protein
VRHPLFGVKIGTVTMVAKAFVDTNILLRSIFVEMDRHEEADELIKQMVNDDTELWISGQVIREFIVQSTHPRTLDEPLIIEEVEVEIKKIKRFYQIADETATVRDTLIDLLKTYPTQGKQVHDANLIATMIANDIDALLTLNIKDFKRFSDRIKLISPSQETDK